MSDILNFQLLEGDCIQVLSSLPENSIDLVVTSPPYEELRKYDNSNNLTDDDFVNFITNVGEQIYRVLDNGGSFILNIQSQVNKKTKERSLSVHKILINLVEKVGFSYIEPYIWAKTSSTPYKSNLRGYNAFEYCFWLSKGTKEVTFNVDNIRKPYSESTLKRYNYAVKNNFGNVNTNGKREYHGEKSRKKKIQPNPKGSLPSNVLHLPQCYGADKNHPAKMQPKVAEFFIKAGANPGDIVLDPFSGSGTTVIEAIKYGCHGVGIDLSNQYIQQSYNDIIKMDSLLHQVEYKKMFDSSFNYNIV